MRKEIDEATWQQMKAEYITTDISYRQLATKYGASYTNIQKVGHRHKWVEERNEFKSQCLKKSVDLIADEESNRIARAIRIGDTMLDKIEESLRNIDQVSCKTTTTIKSMDVDEDGHAIEKTVTTEEFAVKKVQVDKAGLKQLSAVLKDLREIGIFRSELDKMEQEARISKLRKEETDDSQDQTLTIKFADEIESYGD